MRGVRDPFILVFCTAQMVLQRAPKKAAIFGWATPGGKVTVSLAGAATVQAVVDATGAWSASLPPQCASGCVDKQITVTSSDGGSKTLANVAFGDVSVSFCHPFPPANVLPTKFIPMTIPPQLLSSRQFFALTVSGCFVLAKAT